jgi:outer membrane protein OmpA-like peptidoglycan-associated protein
MTVGAPGAVSFAGLTPSSAYALTVVARNAMGSSASTVISVRTAALPAPTPVPTHGTMAPGTSATLTGSALFAANSATLTPQGKDQVRSLSRALAAAQSIRCEGYTDFGGDAVANWWLGLARAQSVCLALRANGVKATETLVSYGQLKPVTTGTHRELNRRVIVFVER